MYTEKRQGIMNGLHIWRFNSSDFIIKYNCLLFRLRNRYFSLLLWHYQIWLKIVIDGISEEVGVMTEGLGLRPYPQENIVTTLYLGKPQKK